MDIALIVLRLVLLHGPDGHEIALNPEQITTMRAALPGSQNKHLTQDARCMISTSDGKFVSVVESCDQVRKLIEDAEKSP
ncbi:hypothetical protein I6F35_02820 [Bradyrhizobium sp. BRP22]|uniref:hypothetical protein n=1 Tax=Bradyrhizobium sp. BRP22 TaxID=2793821 RepID=UPI001CD5A306|nr:hypothetical protein [Bradyrhizobium sp. BRP22]MCA1452147.1 hypothetical protein [Bradyrhizobium sp. BRP22]